MMTLLFKGNSMSSSLWIELNVAAGVDAISPPGSTQQTQKSEFIQLTVASKITLISKSPPG